MAILRGAFNELLRPQMEEMFRGRKVPMTPWDRWKERWTPNWLRWLFPVRYRIIPSPTNLVPMPREFYKVNAPVTFGYNEPDNTLLNELTSELDRNSSWLD